MAIPYFEEVGLADEGYEMMKARNLAEMKQALSRLQLMAQNIMVGTVQGDIYYLRNGRVRRSGRRESTPSGRFPATRRPPSGRGFTRCPTWSRSRTLRAAGCRTATARRWP